MYYLAEVTDPSITSGACISFYGCDLLMDTWSLRESELFSSRLHPRATMADFGTEYRLTLRSMQLVTRIVFDAEKVS